MTRAEKEDIETCFEQNEKCHATLVNSGITDKDETVWEYVGLAAILGLGGGFALRGSLK